MDGYTGEPVPDGFQVNLMQLEDYTKALKETAFNYDQIEDQLSQADLTTADPHFDTLIGHPQYAGPQNDFTEACRTFLTTFRDLYTQIHGLHHQISGKLNYMVQAFVETQQLYQELDSNHATQFNKLLGGMPGGSYDGTA